MRLTVNGVVFNKLRKEQVEYLKANYQDKMKDLEIALGLCDETIYRLLKALKIKRERLWYRTIPNTEEVDALMRDPYLSHVKIADKYGVTPDAVAARRRRMGISVRRNVAPTRLEDKISEILIDMDFAFISQKRIGKWSLDFYLGYKTCIDVHGTWVHKKLVVSKRDKNKTEELSEQGFRYLVIHEASIDTAKEQIEQFLLGFPWQ